MFLRRLPATQRRWFLLFLSVIVISLMILLRQQARVASIEPTAVSPAQALIMQYQAQLRQHPESATAYAQLGLAHLQAVRQTADVGGYGLAEQAFDEALTREPNHIDALIGQGILALARHDFAGALVWATQARQQNPFRAQILGIMVDAYVELGRYEEAVVTTQAMVDLRPDLASYSRVSYLRELHGDVDGAILAMKTAVESGAPGSEQMAWAQVQLATLYLNHGMVDDAERVFVEALQLYPEYAYALAGLARVQAIQGAYSEAIDTMLPIVERVPLPEFVILLGQLYERAGEPAMAARQYELVRLMQDLNAQEGMQVDMELALFEAEHGESKTAVMLAEAAYQQRPSIYAADAMAWALYHDGQPMAAWPYAQEALRLGTQDGMLHYHAGIIAHALGDDAVAQSHLTMALTINPTLDIYYPFP